MADLIQVNIDVNSNADQAAKGLDRLQGSVVNNLKAAERLERGYKTLDRAFNKGKISAQMYAKGMQQVDAAIEQAINGTQQATRSTNTFANSMARAAGNMNQFGRTSVIGGKNLNRTNMMVQQAGYQFQDFAVQIQGGTNAFVALGQQGSQLLGIFGAKGAVLGAILAIATAFANVATSGKQLTVDFKQFGKDMGSAFAPLMPVFTAIGNAFKFIGGVAIDAINFIINWIAKLVTVITYIPSIVAEVFGRAWSYMKVFGNNIAILVNEIKFNFMMGLTTIAQDFAAFVSSTAEVLNNTFNLNLSTDFGSGMLDSLNDSLSETNDTYRDLLAANIELEKSLGGPIKSYEDLKDALEGVGGIDLRDYFKMVAKASEEAEKAAKKLREELEAPLVSAIGSVSNAFGDFISRGLTDFKGFVQQILGSFQSMISQMIAMAVKNRIMLSLGVGGITPAAAQAGQVAGLGSAGGMLGSLGTGAGVAGIAGGTGLLGGAGNAVAGLGGGGAGFFSVGANAAAAGGGAMATIGAAIPVLAAVAVAVALFRKKTKELDSGLNVTVKNMDALVTSFKTVETSRFFGLSKKTSTSTGGVSGGVSDPIVAAVQQIQQSVLTAAEAFGFGADAFDNFSYQFKLSLKGLSEEQQMQKINEELAKMGDSFASLTGHFSSMNELLEAAEQRYQIENRLLEALGRSTEVVIRNRERELAATHELNRGLLEAAFALEDANAAVAATKGVVDAAMDGLRRAIDAQKASIQNSFESLLKGLTERLDVANQAVSRSRSIFELLSNALKSRSLGTMEENTVRRSSAMSFLRSGNISDEKRLENALQAVSEPSEGLFSNFVDYARDFLTTSRVISNLEETAAIQLSADEKAVKLLEQQIDANKLALEAQLEALDLQYQTQLDQVNALLGIDTSVKSVGDAIGTLRGAIEGLMAAQQQAAQASAMAAAAAAAGGSSALAGGGASAGAIGGGASAGAIGGSGGGGSPLKNLGTYSPETALGKNPLSESAIGKQYLQIRGEQNLLSAAQSAGVPTKGKSGAEIQQALSNSLSAVINMDNATRGQRFARGGMFSGGMRLVGEEGPELELTGPSRIYSRQQTKDLLRGDNNDEGVRSAVSALRMDMKPLMIQVSKNTGKTARQLDRWDQDGLPETRVV